MVPESAILLWKINYRQFYHKPLYRFNEKKERLCADNAPLANSQMSIFFFQPTSDYDLRLNLKRYQNPVKYSDVYCNIWTWIVDNRSLMRLVEGILFLKILSKSHNCSMCFSTNFSREARCRAKNASAPTAIPFTFHIIRTRRQWKWFSLSTVLPCISLFPPRLNDSLS